MQRISSISVLLIACLSLALGQQPKAPPRPGLTLTTTAFADGSEIPAKFTQSDPKPVSPELGLDQCAAGDGHVHINTARPGCRHSAVRPAMFSIG